MNGARVSRGWKYWKAAEWEKRSLGSAVKESSGVEHDTWGPKTRASVSHGLVLGSILAGVCRCVLVEEKTLTMLP